LVAIAVAFWWFRISASATEYHFMASGDSYAQTYPMMHRAAQWMRAGHIPLWNPYQSCGHPFGATIVYGYFYPLNFPFLLLRTEVAIEAVTALHLFVAGFLMYLYGRTISLTRMGAMTAGCTFMLSGFLAAQASWFAPSLCSAVWLPLAFIGVEKIFETRDRRWAIALAVAVAMPILAAWLQTWLYSMYAIAWYCSLRFVAALRPFPGIKPLLRPVLLFSVATLLGIMLAGVQLLPSMELANLGPRYPGRLRIEQMMPTGPLPAQTLLICAVGSTPGYARDNYVGMLAFFLLPISLFASQARVRLICLWSLVLGSLMVSLTVYTPLFKLYYMLPGATWFRVPWRILYLYAFAAALLIGVGFDAIADAGVSRYRRWIAIAVGGAVALGMMVVVHMSWRSRCFSVTGLALAVAVAAVRRPRTRAVLASGLLALLVVDPFLATLNPARHPYNDMSVYDAEREIYDFIKERQQLYRTYIHWLMPGPTMAAKLATLKGIYSITDYESLSLERYANFVRQLQRKEVNDSIGMLPFFGLLYLDPTPERLRLLNLLSVRFAVLMRGPSPFGRGASPFWQAFALAGWRVALHPRASKFDVLENPNPLPRAFIVYHARHTASAAAALAAITDPEFEPRNTVVLEDYDAPPSLPQAEDFLVAANIIEYEPTRVVVETNAPRAGYLVLTDTYYPGWRVRVDDVPETIMRANYLFRGVPIAPGHHFVEFVYAPFSFKAGVAMSMVGLAAVALGLSPTSRQRIQGTGSDGIKNLT
jgi:hypothetical protein